MSEETCMARDNGLSLEIGLIQRFAVQVRPRYRTCAMACSAG